MRDEGQFLEKGASAACEVCTEIGEIDPPDAPTVEEIIKLSGMTQSAFARRFGIPLRTVQHWHAGTRKCPKYIRGMMVEILKKKR